MKTLSEIKKEAREELHGKFDWDSLFGKNSAAERAVAAYFDTFADRLVDEIEKAVVQGRYWTNYEYDPEYERGWNDYNKELKEAFTRFKGEVTR